MKFLLFLLSTFFLLYHQYSLAQTETVDTFQPLFTDVSGKMGKSNAFPHFQSLPLILGNRDQSFVTTSGEVGVAVLYRARQEHPNDPIRECLTIHKALGGFRSFCDEIDFYEETSEGGRGREVLSFLTCDITGNGNPEVLVYYRDDIWGGIGAGRYLGIAVIDVETLQIISDERQRDDIFMESPLRNGHCLEGDVDGIPGSELMGFGDYHWLGSQVMQAYNPLTHQRFFTIPLDPNPNDMIYPTAVGPEFLTGGDYDGDGTDDILRVFNYPGRQFNPNAPSGSPQFCYPSESRNYIQVFSGHTGEALFEHSRPLEQALSPIGFIPDADGDGGDELVFRIWRDPYAGPCSSGHPKEPDLPFIEENFVLGSSSEDWISPPPFTPFFRQQLIPDVTGDGVPDKIEDFGRTISPASSMTLISGADGSSLQSFALDGRAELFQSSIGNMGRTLLNTEIFDFNRDGRLDFAPVWRGPSSLGTLDDYFYVIEGYGQLSSSECQEKYTVKASAEFLDFDHIANAFEPTNKLAFSISRKEGEPFYAYISRCGVLETQRDLRLFFEYSGGVIELFDDGTHGDKVARDGKFSRGDFPIPVPTTEGDTPDKLVGAFAFGYRFRLYNRNEELALARAGVNSTLYSFRGHTIQPANYRWIEKGATAKVHPVRNEHAPVFLSTKSDRKLPFVGKYDGLLPGIDPSSTYTASMSVIGLNRDWISIEHPGIRGIYPFQNKPRATEDSEIWIDTFFDSLSLHEILVFSWERFRVREGSEPISLQVQMNLDTQEILLSTKGHFGWDGSEGSDDLEIVWFDNIPLKVPGGPLDRGSFSYRLIRAIPEFRMGSYSFVQAGADGYYIQYFPLEDTHDGATSNSQFNAWLQGVREFVISSQDAIEATRKIPKRIAKKVSRYGRQFKKSLFRQCKEVASQQDCKNLKRLLTKAPKKRTNKTLWRKLYDTIVGF